MFKIRILFIIISVTNLIKCGGANDETSQMYSNFLNFEKMKINLFTTNETTIFDYKDSTGSDKDCMIELNKIGNGVKQMELWAIKRKIFV